MSELQEYVEEIGLYFAGVRLPRMPGRILGWLLVCDPPHQSAEELAAALQVSSGSISVHASTAMETTSHPRLRTDPLHTLIARLVSG
ncbi:hypothetical protein [Flindersiella endophytica]